MSEHIKHMAALFKSLGDEKRLKIIKMLASNRDETFCVSDMAHQLGISQPAVSQHLKVLKNTGILQENRRGFRVFYTIDLNVLTRNKKDIDTLFIKALEKCQYDFSCEKCPFNKK